MDSGIATLLAACLAAIIAIINLIMSITASRQRAKLEAFLDKENEINQEKRNVIFKQLSEFYDPLFTLLSANNETFKKIGPGSEARKSEKFPEEETAEVWSKLVETVILPNNLKAINIIEKKLHLISPEDDIGKYINFSTHAYAYDIFRKDAYEAYRLFAYPKGILEHVEKMRDKVLKQVHSTLNITEKRKCKWLSFIRCSD